MKVHVQGKTYTFSDDDLDNFDLMDIEDVTGLATSDWQDALLKGSGRALTALVWILRRKSEPSLEFKDVRFKLNEIALENDEDEESGKAAEAVSEAASATT